MSVSVTCENKKIFLRFPYDQSLIDKSKRAGLKWSKPNKAWWGHDTIMTRIGIRSEFGDIVQETVNDSRFGIDPDFKPNSLLMDHQLNGLKTSKTNKRWAFFFDTGTGKTLTAIEIIRMWQVKTLVICPISIIEAAWMEDLYRFGNGLAMSSVNLWMIKQKSFENALRSNQVCVINFEGFLRKRKMIEAAGFEMCIVDESSKIKSARSQITKAVIDYCDNIPFVYLLSGTPAPNNDMEYWSQIRVLDVSKFGGSFYAFRQKYFMSVDPNGFKWVPNPTLRQEFMEILASVSTVVRKEDVLDLPERTDIIRPVVLSKAERDFYEEMKRHMLIEIEEEEIEAANAAVKIMKLRQVTAGFILDENKEIRVFGDSKLKALMGLVEEIGKHQIIIWTQFKYEARVISDLLTEMGKATAVINGSVSQNEKDFSISEFKTGKIDILIAHPKSLAHGVTLTNCTYTVYFSLSYSYEEHTQSRDRIYRKGQRNACTYYYLIADNSIDSVIYKAQGNKEDLSISVLRSIQSIF